MKIKSILTLGLAVVLGSVVALPSLAHVGSHHPSYHHIKKNAYVQGHREGYLRGKEVGYYRGRRRGFNRGFRRRRGFRNRRFYGGNYYRRPYYRSYYRY